MRAHCSADMEFNSCLEKAKISIQKERCKKEHDAARQREDARRSDRDRLNR